MTDTQMLQAITRMLSGTSSQVMIIMAIGAAARAHHLNSLMFYRQIWAESRFNPDAVNPKSGCLGLGQMNPKYWPEATMDVESNLELSAGYMEELLDRYDSSYRLALAAYNWGPANLDKLIHGYYDYHGLPEETRAYVEFITGGGRSERDNA